MRFKIIGVGKLHRVRGYHRQMHARGHTQNAGKAQVLLRKAWLQELNAGLICLCGAQAGPVGQALLQGDQSRAHDCALQLSSLFPHRFYLELQRAGRPEPRSRRQSAQGGVVAALGRRLGQQKLRTGGRLLLLGV